MAGGKEPDGGSYLGKHPEGRERETDRVVASALRGLGSIARSTASRICGPLLHPPTID